ncbi:MAG: hypothetical protein ABIR33_10130 [Pyrinomonadaceae bacterium]
MSVFEELIDELKEENLLEETVFSTNRASALPAQVHPEPVTSEGDDDFDLLDSDSDEGFVEDSADEREAYRRRAMDEVSSLQMVEHVLSGIEREHMKMSPRAFDDLEVKKALHKFLQVNAPINSDGHSQAEYKLFQETEKWFSELAKRDNNISVANVRRFCENSRPVLSSQALMALARFYRNSPFSEAVRGKFDFIMTRLFSREVGDEKRKLLFGRIEMLNHVRTLYSNWASLSIVPTEDEGGGPAVVSAVAGFEGFVRESEAVESFDQLITSDFFNRIRLIKESTAELFFEPAVISSAMECNVRIGNRFIDLLQKGRVATGEHSIEEKYGYTYDTIISGAASKTLLLLELLREAREADEPLTTKSTEHSREAPVKAASFERAPVVEEASRPRLLAVNKWLVAATILVLALSAGVFFWSENAATAEDGVDVAPAVNIAGTELTQHVREASTSSETLYGVMQPTWEALSEEEKKQFLAKAFDFAKSRGMKKVNLLNARGRTVGYAAGDRAEVFAPQ